MKTFPTKPIHLLGVCLFAVSTRADAPVAGGNPYRIITAHNSFDLKPAPAPTQAAPTPSADITLTGITTIFGDKRALFKVQPPQPAREQAYFLSEGERVGDLELLSVDVKGGRIKVSNHGIIQVIAICQTPQLSISGTATAFAGGAGGINVRDRQTVSPGGVPNGGGGIPGMTAGQFYRAGSAGGTGKVGAPANDGTGSGLQSGDDPGSQTAYSTSTDPANAGAQNSEPYAIRAARDFEQMRIRTANAVRSGVEEPLPLTPLTPPGTPADLIGPGQAWFPDTDGLQAWNPSAVAVTAN